ncbi:MAG: hypothetical protein IKM13_02670 [Clostridia bacterium]|nr:hypothetical protein [Clostridia bacterium]
MSETRKSLKIIDKNVDLQSKRGIGALLEDITGESEKLIYPIQSNEEEVFYEELKRVEHEFLPRIEGYIHGADRMYALTGPQEGDVLAEHKEKLSVKVVIEMCKDLADTMEVLHEEGFGFNGLSVRDILVNENGLVLPPPAFPADDDVIEMDFASVGGICYELLCGIEYKPGTVISPDTIPDSVPFYAQRVIINATSKDPDLVYTEAKDLIRDFANKKKPAVREKKVPVAAPAKQPSRKAAPVPIPVMEPEEDEEDIMAKVWEQAHAKKQQEAPAPSPVAAAPVAATKSASGWENPFDMGDAQPAAARPVSRATEYARTMQDAPQKKVYVNRDEPTRAPVAPAARPAQTPTPTRKKENTMAPKKRRRRKNKNVMPLVAIGAGAVALVVLVVVLCIALFGGNKYGKVMDQVEEAVLAGNYAEVNSLTAEAKEIEAGRLAAYYYEALALYKQEQYAETISYIEGNIMKKSFDIEPGEEAMHQNIYYMLGCSYFQTGDYENAYKKLSSAESKGYDAALVNAKLALCAVALDNGTALAEVMAKEAMGDAGKAYTEAVALETAGDFNAAAVKYYEAANLQEGKVADYCIIKTVECYAAADDYDSVINSCTNALQPGISLKLAGKLWEEKADAEREKAVANNDPGDLYRTAIKSYETTAALVGDEGAMKCYYYIGECSLRLRDTQAAQDALMKVYEGGDETYSERAHALMKVNGVLPEELENTSTTVE